MLSIRQAQAQRGLSMIDVLIALGIVALLAGLAWPSYADQQRRVARSDALTGLAQLQHWQERWRSQHPRYATLEELGLPELTPKARYRIEVRDPHARGYTALAQANGQQTADASCRVLRLTVLRGNTLRASGPDGRVANDAAANDRCWLQ